MKKVLFILAILVLLIECKQVNGFFVKALKKR